MRTTVQALVIATQALANCRARGCAAGWVEKWEREIARIVATLPSGGGFDARPRVAEVSDKRVVIDRCDFHHMSEHGYYTRWTAHSVIITPSWGGFDVRVTGRDYRDIKDYIGETFHQWAGEDYRWAGDGSK